jgi:hypothetical protein
MKNKIFVHKVSLLFIALALAVTAAYLANGASAESQHGSVDVAHKYSSERRGDFDNFNDYADSLYGSTESMVVLTPKTSVLTPIDTLARRMSAGLVVYFTRLGGWAKCGVIQRTKEEMRERAIKYAYIVIFAAERHSDEEFALNPWGLLGTMLQESGLDPCATGLNPRETAYRLGILKRPRIGISHDKRKLIAALRNTKMKRLFSGSGYDLGLGQMLQRFYDDPDDFELIFDPEYAADQTAKEMKRRALKRKTEHPWEFWRGFKSVKYGNKVVKQAKRAGAEDADI